MARIKIELPEKFSFETIIPIRITDLNYGNHVGNDTILSILHEARVQYLRHYDLEELDFAGVGLIMNDVAVEFKNEIFYGEKIIASVRSVISPNFLLMCIISSKRKIMIKGSWLPLLKQEWSAIITAQKRSRQYRKK